MAEEDSLAARLAKAEEAIEALTKRFNDHLGAQPGASQPLTPHPTLISKSDAYQIGRYL